MDFLKYRKIYYIFSGFLIAGSVVSLLIFGLNLGIDFTGGSILEIEFRQVRPGSQEIQEKLNELKLEEITIQPAGEKGVIIRTKEIEEDRRQEIISRLGEDWEFEEKRFENIGPVVGRELRQKTVQLIIISLTALLIYIVIAFRKVSWPFSGWQYGLISIIALFFDVLVTIGIFAWLGEFYNAQFSIPIVAALLTILGYTINDKVIVFDRVRENILKSPQADFKFLVNKSLNQTFLRSISTGTCSLLVLFSIFFFGGETLKYFSLVLIIGIILGTYSSLLLAGPLLVSWLAKKFS